MTPPQLSAACSVLALLALSLRTAWAAPAPIAVNTPTVGTLVGKGSGAASDFPFTGDGNPLTVVLRYSGGNPVIDPGVGFIIYGAWGVVLNQTESGGNNGTIAATFPTESGASYDLQVYNYIPGFNLTYHLLLSYPDPASPVSAELPLSASLPNGPSDAGLLQRDQAVRRQFWGQTSGTLHNYRFAGDGLPVSLVLNAHPRDPILDGGVGYMVVDQWGNILQNLPLRESATPSSALVWTFTPLAGVNYNVQVFNYQPGVLVAYSVAAL